MKSIIILSLVLCLALPAFADVKLVGATPGIEVFDESYADYINVLKSTAVGKANADYFKDHLKTGGLLAVIGQKYGATGVAKFYLVESKTRDFECVGIWTPATGAPKIAIYVRRSDPQMKINDVFRKCQLTQPDLKIEAKLWQNLIA